MNGPSRNQPAAGIRIRFVHLLVLSAFTTAQPIYDLLTRHPEFLPAHQSERVDILLLTLMLSLLLPGAAALVVRSLARVHPQLGAGTYLALLGLLTAALVLQGLKKLPAPEAAALILSLLSGAGFVFAYCRFSVIRTYLSYLIPAVVLFPLLFLLDSEIRKLILPEPDSEVWIESGAKAPVVVVIFDEFPLISLLNGRREIDSNLFPNLAELAEHSYWFRNATTNNESTLLSIPVILAGTVPRQRPFPLPLFREYPRNLFSLLSGSHELQIRENVTGLNPRRTPAPFGPRFRLLVEDLSVAYLHLLLPSSWASRWLPPVTQTWNQFPEPGRPRSDPPRLEGLPRRLVETGRPLSQLRRFHSGERTADPLFPALHASPCQLDISSFGQVVHALGAAGGGRSGGAQQPGPRRESMAG